MGSHSAIERFTDPTDRRKAPRYRFYADVEIDWGSKVLWGRVHDISREGMFIEIAECPWVSACFSARLALNAPLPVECIVRRIVPGRGIGVTITISDKESKRRFNALLRALRGSVGPANPGVIIPHAPDPPRVVPAPRGR